MGHLYPGIASSVRKQASDWRSWLFGVVTVKD